MKKGQARLRRVFALLRVKDWLPLTGLVLLGYLFAGPVSSFWELGMTMLAGSLFLAQGYGLNNIADVRVDSKKKNPLVGSDMSIKYAMIITVFLVLLGLYVSFLLSIAAATAFFIGVAINVVYSFPPLRLKRFVLSNLIFNSAGFTMLALIGALTRPLSSTELFLFSGFIFLSLIPYQIIHIKSHQDSDPLQGLPDDVQPLFIGSLAAIILWSTLFAWQLHLGGFLIIIGIHSVAQGIVVLIVPRNLLPSRGSSVRRHMHKLSLGLGSALMILFSMRAL